MTLTESQKRAIFSPAPAILVVAGAGSGKTSVATKRIARLISDGTDPGSILVITFTRKAARELKTRLEKLIGPQARKIWCGTFHAISYRILAQWGERIGYQTTGGRSISVVSPDESEIMLDNIVQEYGWKGSMKTVEEAKSILAHTMKNPDDPDLQRIIREYHARLRECNAVDFDQLLLEVHRLFRECPEALAFYRNRFTHVFVDEYQDTDHAQYSLHEVLAAPNLFCVGDPDQAIYGWRGADVSIILDFETAHPGAEVIKLEECFRCGRPIVEAANNLIFRNKDRIEKRLVPTIEEGDVSVKTGEAQNVAGFLSEDLAFADPAEVAVIARTHNELEKVLQAGEILGLDLHKVGAKSDAILGSYEFKTFLAVLRMAINPRDSIAWHCFGGKWTGLQDQERQAIQKKAILDGCSPIETYLETFPKSKLTEIRVHTTRTVWMWFCVWMTTQMDRINSTHEAIWKYLDANVNHDLSPEDFMVWIQTRDNQAELERGQDRITLLTAHACKGLEWDTVILAGFDQKTFPSARALREGHLEEERRLGYVAMTRARKRLVIFTDNPSQFIREAGL